MILIAHKGNINGPKPKLENKPEYILNAINSGYHAEIDLWFDNNKWALGHDYPQYYIDLSFLEQYADVLWIHCKDYYTLKQVVAAKYDLNFFYHTTEDYVLTRKGYIWAYPGKPGSQYTVCVMPEWNNFPVTGFYGVCSDFVEKYK